ncbi:MAG TPA: hypothetical protein VFS75_00060 [Candidatus Paceibacterota bacterium]|nr:hypothetical protein [Candidatus Paceibacterota bacterium]
MKVLWNVAVFFGIAIALSACGGVTVRHTYGKAEALGSRASCPAPFDKDAIAKVGYPEVWAREPHEPATVWPLYRCSFMQPLIAWAKSASNYESDRGGCTLDYQSFTCRSHLGPSGTSRHGRVTYLEGSSRIDVAIANLSVLSCPNAGAEDRELDVSVDPDGRWRFSVRHECYY